MTELSPRERRHARTRQEILNAALEILHEGGPEKISLREIARRVDYSPAGLYEYFASKEEIIDAVCAEGDRRLQHYLRKVPDDLPPDIYLIELGLAYVRYARENPDHFLLNVSRPTPDMPPVPIEDIQPGDTLRILLEGVQKAIDAGVIKPRNGYSLHAIAYSLRALAHGVATLQLTNMKNILLDYDEADRTAFRAFIRGLGTSS